MLTVISGLTAIAAYLGCTVWLVARLRTDAPDRLPMLLPLLGLLAHALATWGLIRLPGGYDLSFFRVPVLIFLLLVGIAWLSSRRLPIRSLLLLIYPMAALSISLALATPASDQPRAFPAPIAAHILLSILAYSLITLATLQALALAMQDHLLKQHRARALGNMLPPLEVMETLLFRMIGTGFTLLSLAILSGLLFLDNLFTQHLVHKTVFSAVAWVVFAILLWGRHRLGWRSRTALRWTLAGFFALMLAFFGSKFVLELLLQRAY